MAKVSVSQEDVRKIAKLASLTVTKAETERYAAQFSQTLAVVVQLNELETSKIKPTDQVTGETNVWREDEVDEGRMFTQEQALSQARRIHQGYFVVEKIIDKNE